MERDSFGSSEIKGDKEKDTKRKKQLRFGVPVAKVEGGEKSAEAPKAEESKSRSLSQELADKILKGPAETAEASKPASPNQKETAGSDKPEKVETADVSILPAAESTAAATERNEAEQNAETTPEAEVIAKQSESGEQDNHEPESAQPEQLAETQDPAVENDQEDDTESDAEAPPEPYAEMPRRELKPQELGGGEVIRLRDQPIAEGVISLRPESAPVQPAAEQSTEPTEAAAQPQPESEQPESKPFVNPYETFSRQPEQQQQARDEQEPNEPQPEAGAGGGGEVPPTDPPESGGTAPESPEPEEPDPADPAGPEAAASRASADTDEGGGFVDPNRAAAAPDSERPATAAELEDVLRRNTRRNSQRGVLTGLLFGSYFANRKLKREQKKQAKELAAQKKELRQQGKDIRTVTLAQTGAQTNVEQRVSQVEKRHENPQQTEKQGAPNERRPQSPRFPEANRSKEPEPAEQLDIPADHHVETSAWHSIEVDNKTGKAVETPAFQYGPEYYHERAQELTPAAQRAAAAGETALVAAALSQAQSGQKPDDPAQSQSAQIPDASTQGAPSDSKSDDSKLAAVKDKAQAAGPIWPLAIALVVVIILLALLIH